MIIAEPQSGWRGEKKKVPADRKSEDYHGDEQTSR